MLNPKLYDAIFARKSIRKYAGTPLTQEQITAVQAAAEDAVPLFPDEKYRFVFSGEADAYRVNAYCEETPVSRANAGFMLQQIDLALHLQGLGRLWFGMGREPKGVDEADLSYFICMKVGIAAEPLSRKAASEFDRKPISEVIGDERLQKTFEAVRLAPSAANNQPWLFVKDGREIHLFRQKLGTVKNAMFGKMNQGDMGIALCHAVLALEHDRHAIKEIRSKSGAAARKGYEYAATVSVDS